MGDSGASGVLEQRIQSLVNASVDDIAQRYVIREELGSGAQATVYKATHKKTNAKVAIKVIESKELEDDELYDALRMEVMLMKQLKHPNIVTLQEVVRDRTSVYIVQECLGGGELFDKLLAKGPFNEEETLAIFAQVALALDYMHSVDVVHRDLKAENLVFVAKGSPQIKLIDFGGASPWTPEEGLTGLVGTPQYVAPEVVTGYGDVSPTEQAYGKACDLWSLGVLLYVMLSKMMPFRAKEVDLLLKQVVKGKFSFKPDDRWMKVSDAAKDMIAKLLVVDPSKRLTIQQVKEHRWAREAIAKCEQNLPKLEAKLNKASKTNTSGFFKLDLLGTSLKSSKGERARVPASKKKGVSREQQYWYAMEISPPSDMQQLGGVRVAQDGTFQMDNIPPEMQAVLEEIQRKKAAATDSARNSTAQSLSSPTAASPGGQPNSAGDGFVSVPPPQLPPPPRKPPPSNNAEEDTPSDQATMHRLTAENTAYQRHQTSDALDTLVLIRSKDDEIAALTEQNNQQAAAIERLQSQLAELRADGSAGVLSHSDSSSQLHETQRQLKETVERAEKSEAALGEQMTMQMKLQAKLAAVTTLYTETMQREAALKVTIEHLKTGE